MQDQDDFFNNEKGHKPKSYALPEDMIIAIKLLAKRRNLKESDIVRECLRKALNVAVKDGLIPIPPYPHAATTATTKKK